MTLLLVLTLALAAGCAVLALGARTWAADGGGKVALRRGLNVAGALLVLGFLALAAVPAYGHLSGDYRILPVLSGSMEPVMARGDAAWVRKIPLEDLAVGDVLVFDPPGEEAGDRTTIHRVIELVPEETIAPTDRREGAAYVRTQGDANEDADRWTASITDQEVWVHERTVPMVGNVITAGGSGAARSLAMVVAALLIGSWGVRAVTATETKQEVERRLARRAQGEAWLLVASGDTTDARGTTAVEVPEVPDDPVAGPRESARKASRPVTVVMTVIAVILGGTMFASHAAFFDSERLQATLDAGVVAIESGGDGLLVPISDLLPGDGAQQLLTLETVGTLDLRALQLLIEGDDSPLVTDTSDGLQLTVEWCSQPWTLGPDDPQGRPTDSCGGTVELITGPRPVLGTVDLPDPPFAAYEPEGIDHLRLLIELPDTAPPSMADESTEVGINIIAVQREGTNR